MDGLKEGKATLVVHIHPSKAKCAHDAVLTELSSLLFTYSEAYDGVVLAYDLNIFSNLAKILPGIHPTFGVKLKASLLLFKPTPDMILEGRVVKITARSIHAVVLGFSSVFIAAEDIRSDFNYKSKHGEEVYVCGSNEKHRIKVGTLLRFVVKSFDEEILHIAGSMVADNTGCARWLDKNTDELSQADSTHKKRKNGKQEAVKPEEDEILAINEKTSSVQDASHVKKSKKKRKVHS